MAALTRSPSRCWSAGLRSICEEMGAALIRSAHSPNIKERHDCSTALFDADGELVMQAEHIPVHLGSMPDAVGGDPRRGPAPRRPLDPQRPVPGRHPPPGHHADLADLRRRRAARLRRQPRPPRRHRRRPPRAGCRPSRRPSSEEGIVIPPDAGRRRGAAGPRRADAQPGPAARRPARPARGEPARRPAPGRAGRPASAPTLLERGHGRGPRLLRAAHPSRFERRSPTAVYEATDVLESRRGAGPAAGRRADLRRRSSSSTSRAAAPQVDGNLNCPLPVTRSAALFAVRVLLDPDAPPSAGGHRPISITAPRGLDPQRRTPARPSPPATSRPRAGSPTSSSRRSAGVAAAPAQGQGTMNNLTLSNDRLHLLRDDRRRSGRLRRPPRPRRGPRGDVEHAQHPVEALESELPVRVRELGLRRGSGGGGRSPGRRRRRPRDRGAGADAIHPDHRAASVPRRVVATAARTAPSGATCSTASRSAPRPRAA